MPATPSWMVLAGATARVVHVGIAAVAVAVPHLVCVSGVSEHARLRISTYHASLLIAGASPGRGASLPRGSPPVGLANNAYNKPAGGRGGGYPMQQPLGQQLQMSIGCVSCVRSSSLLRASIP